MSGTTLLSSTVLLSGFQRISAQNKNFDFLNSFQIPPLDFGKRKGNDVYFELILQQGTSSFLPNLQTNTLGINGNYLGPTIRVHQGDQVHIKVRNQIGETSTIHWHGMSLPAKMDGGPHQPIQHGASWLAEFDIQQPASMLWYHSHQLHKTGEQVYRGLAGLFIIDDERSQALNLPSDYGVDDIPVVLQDRDFNSDGSFHYISSMHDQMMGKQGSMVLVNGVISPVLKAQRSLLRFRILNGSNARIYNLAFSDGGTFLVIGGDCGLLSEPVAVNQVRLAPAERVDILVDISNRNSIILKSLSATQSTGGISMMEQMMNTMMNSRGMNQELDLFKIDVSDFETSQHTVPKQLVQQPVYASEIVRKVRPMELNMRMMQGGVINGKAMDMDRIDERVKPNSLEIWEINNLTMMAHPFHVHNVQFQLLSRSSGHISAHESGLKDTVLVSPNESVKILIPFPEYTDRQTPYMYHCHILEHEDSGMMGQFIVSA